MRTMQKGFSIITAIFLLVVLSFLGVAMVTFSTTQHQSSAMDVMGSRAYQAARAGIEWAAYNVSVAGAGAQWLGCVANTGPGALGGTLQPFAVDVDCTATAFSEGGNTIWVYDVTSTATTGGAPGDSGNSGYVERVISVKLGGTPG